MKIFKDLWWFFKQEKRAYIIGVIALVTVSLLSLIPARLIGKTVDAIADRSLTMGSFLTIIATLVVTAGIMYGLRYVWRAYIFGSSLRLERQMRNSLFKHLTNMSGSFFQKHRTGDLMAHATNDLKSIQQVAGAGILTLADSVLTGGMVIVTMATLINWKLTLIALLPMPLIAISSQFLGKKLHISFRDAQSAFSDMNDYAQETIGGTKVTKTFGQEGAEIKHFQSQTNDVRKKNVIVARLDSAFDPAINIIVALSYALTLFGGAYLIRQSEITIGDLVSFITYLGMLVWPMLAFGFLYNILERGSASYDRVAILMANEAEVTDREGAVDVTPTGDITVDVEEVRYADDKLALHNIHFKIGAGETLGIVGRTGAGKTTLVQMLLRQVNHYEGLITIGGRDIKDYTLDSLRRSIGYVPQDQFLFSTTIRENIRFGRPEATQEEVEAVTRLTAIHDDIEAFTEGYDTVVGERGVSLSGGQKQRISIARALLMNPELLILDDALSAVDAKTEEAIVSALKETRSDKTTIICAHRLSSVQHSEQILVLENGELAQSGRHAELMLSDGWYSQIFEQQQLVQASEGGEG
ncbi:MULTISPECIES: ABC transporter ATP-binding protein [Brochothrix]|uniref:Efflux ABC transporter (ATP-binding protein) n=1 Tax=Brochothrix thermosphacta TaxID=2756 RepID=A0A2X0QUT4_BROTH|nr:MULTISPECIES: ABC transporter transmembrane domain-containing protein [Brochothrix]ANZ97709.1 multidrug ABC transporter permease/ATP-binding protein [Brochothrix thermosphacta]MBR5526246.1 ATP-binding cassette domain-containing protein [Brochothrix sp.]MDO7863082.1 ABC transporter transmembrane domain-containing protein [Brochothrix thermosphacta]ODJ65987.1 multidrug ABC transporter permease/ATP-binding protein [Brochothrix thermosphacta]ODJ70424.1 multidrug ABC transporter permease/ATP-bin